MIETKTNKQVDTYLSKVSDAVDKLSGEEVEKFVDILVSTYQKEGAVYIFGNGGSAATASHFAGDFVKGVSYGLEKRFKVVCLNDNNAAMMAIANDISYDDVFVEQLKNFATKNDLVIGISGSGNSTNVLRAIEYANKVGAYTVGLTGYSGGKLKDIAAHSVNANIDDMEISEDIHMIITHCVKNAVKDAIQ